MASFYGIIYAVQEVFDYKTAVLDFRRNKIMHKSRLLNWKKLGIAALLLLPAPFVLSNHQVAKADAMPAKPAPVAISGTVKQYFTNRAGFVSALSLETSSGTEMIHFAPSWAKRLLAHSPVGKSLDGWVIPHREGKWSWNDLVSLGKDSPSRILKEKLSSGAQQLDDSSWIWKTGKPAEVHGKLKKIVVNGNGDVLALVLDNGALVRVPKTVRNEELGAIGTDAIAPLFKDVEVSAWGTPEWQASGDVSIYNQHLATDVLAINGKTVSAIGIPRLSPNQTTIFGGRDGNINLINARPAEIIGADGEYAPFGNDALPPLKNTFQGSPRGAHIGHAMLQTSDGRFYPAIHQGIQVFAVVRKEAFELPLVNDAYVPPVNMPGSRLVMVMDDGRQFEMSSSDGRLYVDLPDGNKSPVNL